MMIFSGTSNPALAKKIAGNLKTKLSSLEIYKFPDKEVRVRVLEKVLGKHTIVVQSTGVHPNHYYMQLFFILDAIKRSGGSDVTLVIPYLGYQRQDHIFRSGEAVSLEVIVNLIKAMKVDRVISFDLHAPRISEFFVNRKIKIDHLSALPVFADEIRKIAKKSFNDIVLVSPDMGGIRRIKILADLLEDRIPCISIEKNRNLNTGEIESTKINGEVKKTTIIVDDVISTGKTLIAAADLLKKNGASDIYVMATHGIFAGDAPIALQNSIIKKVIISDTLEIRPKRRFDKLHILSVSSLISETLKK